jgi:hypothetical protein
VALPSVAVRRTAELWVVASLPIGLRDPHGCVLFSVAYGVFTASQEWILLACGFGGLRVFRSNTQKMIDKYIFI